MRKQVALRDLIWRVSRSVASCVYSRFKTVTVAVFGSSLFLLAGCTSVFDTVSIREPNGLGCQSEVGGYYLPKKHIVLTISQGDTDAKPDTPYTLNLAAAKSVPDTTQPYCLDYVGSATAEDTIKVIRDSNLLLTMVTSTNEDKLKDIIEKATNIGLIAATGNADFGLRAISLRTEDGDRILAYHNFDPFDRGRLAEINEALRGYGYCVLIVNHTVDLARLSPAQRRAFPSNYCGSPHRFVDVVRDQTEAKPEVVAPEEARRGILYRADQTHQIVVFRKRDPKSYDSWQIYLTKQIEMPNLSPVFSVAVDRSLFVKRETTLMFNGGVLQDVTVDKPSEMLEVAGLSLRIAQAVVSVPAEIVQVRITAANNRTRLIQAQRELIMTRTAYLNAIKSLPTNHGLTLFGNRSLPTPDLDAGSTFRAQQQATEGPDMLTAAATFCGPRCAGRPNAAICLSACRSHVTSSCPPPSSADFERCVRGFQPR